MSGALLYINIEIVNAIRKCTKLVRITFACDVLQVCKRCHDEKFRRVWAALARAAVEDAKHAVHVEGVTGVHRGLDSFLIRVCIRPSLERLDSVRDGSCSQLIALHVSTDLRDRGQLLDCQSVGRNECWRLCWIGAGEQCSELDERLGRRDIVRHVLGQMW